MKKYLSEEELIDRVANSSFINQFMSDSFTQNFYAAFCNNEYAVDNDPELLASFSWRSSGGLVANIRYLLGMAREGECYLDWYCSGGFLKLNGYVAEDTITEEIRTCLKEIGLTLVENNA